MAVVITSKFYQANAWKDISKIVFTSPNLDSPAVAGTRSHILPGEGDLGTWYEDTSSMYRIESTQQTTDSDFYNYRMECKDTIDFKKEGYIDVYNANTKNLDSLIKEYTNVELLGYTNSVQLITDKKSTLEYTTIQKNINEIFEVSPDRLTEIVERRYKQCSSSVNILYYTLSLDRNYGWYTPIITELPQCHITFEFQSSIKISAISMSSVEVNQLLTTIPLTTVCNTPTPTATSTVTNKTYFFGNFNVQGSNDENTWTTLYTGANTTNLTKFIYFNTAQYFKFYRINILNNTGLNSTTFDVNYYGMRALKLYTYEFSDEDGSEDIALYEFSDPDNPRVFKINNIFPLQDEKPTNYFNESSEIVEGTVTTTTSGIFITYDVDLGSFLDPNDYITIAKCVAVM